VNIFDEIIALAKDVLAFFQIDDDAIRFFVYGGTGAIVSGITDDKQKTFRRFLAIAFVGAAMASFVTPAIIQFYDIKNIKYQMLLGFLIGVGSMILVSKIIRWFKSMTIKNTKIEFGAKEGEDDASV